MEKKEKKQKLEPSKIPRTYLIIGIIIVVILLLLSIYLFIQNIGNSLSNANNHITEFDKEFSNISDKKLDTKTSIEQCFKEIGINAKLAYLYLPTCPYCKQMNPIIDSLISRGYSISKLDASNTKNYVDVSMCAKIQAVTPQYICTLNGAVLEGSVSEEELIGFYDKCKSSV